MWQCTRKRSALALFMLSLLVIAFGCGKPNPVKHAKKYLNKSDKVFDWEVQDTSQISTAVKSYEIDLTSQTWQDRTWTHELNMVVPNDISDKFPVFLFIARDRGSLPLMRIISRVAKETGYAIAILNNVPNQPDFGGLKEDDLIAHTFSKFIKTGDTSWPLLLPMTKSASRAMDTIEQFAKQRFQKKVDWFVTGGASKRGWTSWLTAAYDNRVKAIVPFMFDAVNLPGQLRQQQEIWGEFSNKIQEYTSRDLHKKFRTDRGKFLLGMLDPYQHRQKLDLPKLIISVTNDHFWTLKAADHFWDELLPEKSMFYIPNAHHRFRDGLAPQMIHTVKAFLMETRGMITFPEFSADLRTTSPLHFTINQQTDHKPVKVELWKATSDSMDFRNTNWTSQVISDPEFPLKERIHTSGEETIAMFARMYYKMNGHQFSLSTQVHFYENGEHTADTK